MQLQARQARYGEGRISARLPISLAEVAAPSNGTCPDSGTTTLWFRLLTRDPKRLDAVRAARRAMIREELTGGLEPGEPSLAEAAFSPSGVLWEVPIGELARCREKLAQLMRRANAIDDEGAARRFRLVL